MREDDVAVLFGVGQPINHFLEHLLYLLSRDLSRCRAFAVKGAMDWMFVISNQLNLVFHHLDETSMSIPHFHKVGQQLQELISVGVVLACTC